MEEIKSPLKTAILMTCYNRVETTLKCLENLHKASFPDNIRFDIYLVDDKSPDNTGKIVKKKYPDINIILGTGSLYWNRGMRFAWKNARRNHDYDFYLWINDDTLINTDAIEIIFSDYYSLLNNGIEAIVSGVCQESNSPKITYGGSDKELKLIVPNGFPQPCRYTNGNFTLISKKIFHKIGFLSYKYTHAAGDYDYSLRAVKSGFKCYISSSILAVCPHGETERQDWQNHDVTLRKRIKNLFLLKRRNCRDDMFLIYEDSGLLRALKYIIIRVWIVFFPKNVKNNE